MPALNSNLQKLFTIAQKNQRLAVGLMSGTSLDGLDIALCRFTGSGFETQFNLLEFVSVPYNDDFKNDIRLVFAQRHADMEMLCLLNARIGLQHAQLVLQALKQWQVNPHDVDFIASHGQTVYHAPARLHGHSGYPNATLQIGDADHIAVKTGIITISDFRQKHVAAGGEGAPLVLYGDFLLGSKSGQNRILLNIGGIANLTFLPGQNAEGVICADTGPGNTLIDAACKKHFGKAFDQDGRIALSGQINMPLLEALLGHMYFTQPAPKTTGPEQFNPAWVEQAQQQTGTENIPPPDLIATLTALTAHSIAAFVKANLTAVNIKLYVSGGGGRNPFLMQQLQAALPGVAVDSTAAIGIHPAAKEAVLFALLGNEAIAGQPLHINGNPAVLMGKFSFPY